MRSVEGLGLRGKHYVQLPWELCEAHCCSVEQPADCASSVVAVEVVVAVEAAVAVEAVAVVEAVVVVESAVAVESVVAVEAVVAVVVAEAAGKRSAG